MIVDGLQINNWSRPVIDEVRSGGVDIVHATVGVWEDLAATMTRIGAFRHLCRHNADAIRIVRSVEEMHQAKTDGVLGIVLGFQNSSMLGDDPEMAGIFADVGVRVVQLTYNIANHLGSSCWEPNDGGLTRAGHRMVSALNDAGVLVDISHVGDRTGRDAVDASAHPIAITHGNPRSFCDSPRNKPDDLVAAVAARGGVIGCTLYPLFMGGADVTPSRLLRHARPPRGNNRRRTCRHWLRRRPRLGSRCTRVDAKRAMEPSRRGCLDPRLPALADLVRRSEGLPIAGRRSRTRHCGRTGLSTRRELASPVSDGLQVSDTVPVQPREITDWVYRSRGSQGSTTATPPSSPAGRPVKRSSTPPTWMRSLTNHRRRSRTPVGRATSRTR